MKKIAISTLLLAAFAAPAFAADEGFYAGIKLGQANYNYTNLTKNNPTAFGVLGGYSYNQNIAVEAEYADLGSFGNAGTAGKSSAWGIAAVGSYPFNESFSLFGKLGIASTSTKATPVVGASHTANKTSATYGLGGQYNVNKSVGIRFGWDAYKVGDAVTGTGTANMYSVGAVFKF